MSTATATNNNSNIDDIFAVARKFHPRDRELTMTKFPPSPVLMDLNGRIRR